MIRKLIGALLFAIAISAPSFASESAEGKSAREVPSLWSWMGQQTATGNWGGVRSKLESQGLTISSNYTTDIMGNPAGGLKQTTKYAGFLDLAFALDFEKIASIKGLALTISNFLASGQDISAAIGNFFTVQEIYVPGSYYFGELDLSLSMIEDTLTLEAGRLFAGDVFAASPLWQYYVNGGINDNLNSMPANIFFPAFQITSWATRVTYEPNRNWCLAAGFYNADTNVEKINNYGADLSFDMDQGYLAIGQLTYKHGQARGDNGLPGSVTFGSYYESGRFQDLLSPTKRWHGNYGFYLMGDQMLFRGDWPEFSGPSFMRAEASWAERSKQPYHPQTALIADRPVGLTAWAAAYLAPQDRINTQTYQLAGGLVYQGLPPGRSRDVTAFCAILGHFSDQLDGQGIETVLELNHRLQFGPWFYITPDIQYIINPNGQTNIRNALVLGAEISVNF